MTEFQQEIAERIGAARRSLEQARLEGDDYLISVRTGEIESLQRMIDEHGGSDVIAVDGAAPVTLLPNASSERAAS